MNEGLHTSERGQKLIQAFESCLKRLGNKFTTYYCPAGVLTIGWGHTNANGRKFKEGDVWTQGECDAALREDIAVAERAVRRRVKVELTQFQFDALASFVMNCGEGNFAKSSLLRKVNAEDFDGAADEFAKWNRGGGKVLKGLTRRRAAESDLFRTGNHDLVHAEYKGTPEYHEPSPQQVDAPPGTAKPMSESKIGNAQIGIGLGSAAEAASQVSDAVNQANSVKQGAQELGVADVLGTLVSSPMFWLAVAIGVAAVLTWFWRREHAQEGV